MLPKIIHFVLLGENHPAWVGENIDRFRAVNPGWEVMIHDKQFDMADEYRSAFAEATTVGEQSDVMRLAAVERWGGWYFDWDIFAIKPLDGMKSSENLDDKLLLCPSRMTRVFHWALAGTPEAPVWDHVHKIMAELAEEGAPNGTTYERAVCDALSDRCPQHIRAGLVEEYGLVGSLRNARTGYKGLVDGTWEKGTGEAFFVHGWNGLSHKPPR